MSEDRFDTIRHDYDRIAEEYAIHIGNELAQKPFDREVLLRFAAATGGREAVCDMGCGPGHIARFLHDSGSRVFGIDLSPQMLQQARRLNPDIEFREGDLLSLPVRDGALSGIAAFYCIVNLPQQSLPAAFAEMHRVLQPGGLLLLAFHLGDEVLRPAELWGRPVSMEFFYHPLPRIQQLLCEAGFAIQETLEREPYAPEVEHQSRRAYIFARKEEQPAA